MAHSKENKNRGLGDWIEGVTIKYKLKQAFDWFNKKTGLDCGCKERKEFLNRKFPNRGFNCLTREQLVDLKVFFSNFDGSHLSNIERETLAKLHSEIFGHAMHYPCTTCPKGWKNYIRDLKELYKTYDVNKYKNNERNK